MKTILNEKYYDIPELCEIFGLSITTMRKYLRDGKIDARKIGKSWYSKDADVKDFLDNTVKNNIKNEKQ